MKKLFSLLGALLLLAVPLMFTSCDDVPDNPVKPTPTPKAPTYKNDNYRPLTFEATKANITVTFKISGSNIAPSSVEYSLDKGATWTPLSSANQAILLANVGDMVMFRGNNASYNGEAQFVIASAASEARGGTRQLTMSDKLANAIGNIYSLVFGKSISGSIKLTAENANALKNILKDCPIDAISDDGARRLVASSRNLAPGVLEGFLSGTLITEAPDLRASVMEKDCYKDAFSNCPYVSKVTMLATKCADGLDPIDCLSGWMDNSGGEVPTGDDKVVILNKNAEASFLNKIEDQLPPGDTWEIVDTKGEEIETVAQYIVYDAEGNKTSKDIPANAKPVTASLVEWSDTLYVDADVTIDGDVNLTKNTVLILMDGKTLTVKGTIFGGADYDNGFDYALNIYGQEKSDGALTINYSGTHEAGVVTAKELNIHGGVITVGGTGVMQGLEPSTLNVYNGTIDTSGKTNGIMALGPMNVYNGELTATSTSGAAISMWAEGDNSAILTIYDGKVAATSAAASGIEANDPGGDTGDITIKGGEVTATGGTSGICSSSSIIISGGKVIAKGGLSAAGIGSADSGVCGVITITGGTVIAIGDEAGIGTGANGTCGDIEISGGDVTAVSSSTGTVDENDGTGAGIGAGGGGTCGAISISGGTVVAKAGCQAAAIGSSSGGSSKYTSLTISSGITKVTAILGTCDTTSPPIGKAQGDETSPAPDMSGVDVDTSIEGTWICQ